ncbi:Oidioi.mRNA.OKI2018_I69.chr2.g6698.t1.cds [Oikopleura dioica]|uniref:Oidioi.mRNA.OKI2018_I69.chr2.g6698.t1.cds n=1 Tax=Oikopleura dioica TaxID=34765 RepID=A0ABN7T499_OIKDI|nr:Oidioi.mRNA.OKI2018_I69.chr2.g6698.t1.cds [Oikopleura dioica]
MVFFSCGLCGEQIKKPKVEKHLGRCRSNELTCIDCNVTFNRMSYDGHKSCVTENERYGGKDYVEKGNKGDEKQRIWLEKITTAMKKAKLSPAGMKVWKMLENGGFENIPRKEKKFVNFVKNSLNMRDTGGIDEVWKIFDAAFEKQTPTTPAKKAKSTAVEVKATGDKPWWEQFTPTKKKSGKESSSSDADSESEEEKLAKKTPQKKKTVTKRKKESSSSSSDSEEEPAPKKEVKKVKNEAKKAPKKVKSSSSSSDSSDEETPKAPAKKKSKVESKKAPKKESSSESSSSDEEDAPKQTSSPLKKIVKKVPKKAESSPDTSSSEEDAPIKKKKTLPPKKTSPVAKPVPKKVAENSSSESSSSSEGERKAPKKAPVKKQQNKKAKESSSSSSSSSEEEPAPKKKVEAIKAPVKKTPAKKESSSSSSSSSEDEPVPKKKAPVKKLPAKKAESSSSSSSSEDEAPAPKKVVAAAQKKKATAKESSSSSSSEDEKPAPKKVAPLKKAAPVKKPQESSSSSSSSSEDEKPAPKKSATPAKKKVLTKKVQASSSSSSSSCSEDEAPAKKKTPVVKKSQPAKKAKESSSSSSSSSSSEEEKPVAKKKAKVTKDATSDSEDDSASSGIGSDEDASPVKKLKSLKHQTKKVHSNKDDYNKERDSRTIFIKNLPFDTTVDDLWHVFGKDEEMTIDCRFIMNRETGTHKGLAFVEYASREKCVEMLEKKWKMNGRPAIVMQAGTKKPATNGTPGPNSGLSQDERDLRTLFVKGLPFSSTPDDLVELFGCLQARLLKDHAGQSKGMAFCEFETPSAADEVYNYADGYELGGRWLQLDKLRPKSQMNGGSTLKFELQIGDDPRCLSIEAAAESKVDWTYVFEERDQKTREWVLTKEKQGVHIEVTPKGDEYPLLSKSYSGKGKFVYTTQKHGMHTICFSPAKLQEENIRLTLSRKIGAFENEEIIAEIDDFFHFSEAEKVTNLQFEFGKTKNRVDQILKELNYQRSREGDFREISQEVNDAVLKFAFIQVLVLVILGGWQIYNLKSFFLSKKLV